MLIARKLFVALGATAAVIGAGAAPSQAIVKGTPVPAGQYTNVADITIADAAGCSGTLITPTWVMTAGHCASITAAVATGTPVTWPPQAYDVKLGSNKPGQGTSYSVKTVVLEPGYLAVTGYDISLLELTAPVTSVPSTPLAGPALKDLWKTGTVEKIVGWGVTKSGGSASATLQQADVPIVTDAACAKAYENQQDSDTFWSGFDAATMICAGDGVHDTCQGDSGGPMFATVPATGELRLVASTSYGEGCADPDYPGIYARVADDTLRAWVASVAGPGSVKD